MLCHNKKRQRLKEYINYKLNKYYTVIFTLIIWDFLSFFFYFLFVLCSSKCWPFLFPLSSCHRWVDFTSQWTPHYDNQLFCLIFVRKVLCIQKKSCSYCATVVWNVIKSSIQVGEEESEEVSACKQVEVTDQRQKESLFFSTSTYNSKYQREISGDFAMHSHIRLMCTPIGPRYCI